MSPVTPTRFTLEQSSQVDVDESPHRNRYISPSSQRWPRTTPLALGGPSPFLSFRSPSPSLRTKGLRNDAFAKHSSSFKTSLPGHPADTIPKTARSPLQLKSLFTSVINKEIHHSSTLPGARFALMDSPLSRAGGLLGKSSPLQTDVDVEGFTVNPSEIEWDSQSFYTAQSMNSFEFWSDPPCTPSPSRRTPASTRRYEARDYSSPLTPTPTNTTGRRTWLPLPIPFPTPTSLPSGAREITTTPFKSTPIHGARGFVNSPATPFKSPGFDAAQTRRVATTKSLTSPRQEPEKRDGELTIAQETPPKREAEASPSSSRRPSSKRPRTQSYTSFTVPSRRSERLTIVESIKMAEEHGKNSDGYGERHKVETSGGRLNRQQHPANNKRRGDATNQKKKIPATSSVNHTQRVGGDALDQKRNTSSTHSVNDNGSHTVDNHGIDRSASTALAGSHAVDSNDNDSSMGTEVVDNHVIDSNVSGDSASTKTVDSPEQEKGPSSSSHSSSTDRSLPLHVVKDPSFPDLYKRYSLPRQLPTLFISTYGIPPPSLQASDMDSSASISSNPVESPLNLYHPRYTRYQGMKKEGLCPLCLTWYKTKISAYNYHLTVHHGINHHTGLPFDPPVKVAMDEKKGMKKGLCHHCHKWIDMVSVKSVDVKVPEIYWRKHAARCHNSKSIRLIHHDGNRSHKGGALDLGQDVLVHDQVITQSSGEYVIRHRSDHIVLCSAYTSCISGSLTVSSKSDKTEP
ncbi:unnamed protein product [Sympodiomycopsis kandeliae]